MKNFTFSKYCTPAYLNVALGVAILIGAFLSGLKKETLALEALFIGIWALGVKWLCSKGYKIISWSLAVVPVILALYMVILVKNDVATKEGIDNKTPGTDGDNISKTSGADGDNISKIPGTAGDNISKKPGATWDIYNRPGAFRNVNKLLDNAKTARSNANNYINSYNREVPIAATKRAAAEKATKDAGDAYLACKVKAYAARDAVNANPKSDVAKIDSDLAPYWRNADNTYTTATAAINAYQDVQNNANNELAKSNNAINAATAAESAYRSAASDFKSKYPYDYLSIEVQAAAVFKTPIAKITQQDVSTINKAYAGLSVVPPDFIRRDIYPGKTKQ